ncbi:MAG TPA: hypothetical protein VEI74_14370 [Candidatus Methylomirabilis sp.]|nr:hypothetical protein [Candidatus Methylomirabilis sp.]
MILVLVMVLVCAVAGVVAMRVVVLGTLAGFRDLGERFRRGGVVPPEFFLCDQGGMNWQIDSESRGPFASSAQLFHQPNLRGGRGFGAIGGRGQGDRGTVEGRQR